MTDVREKVRFEHSEQIVVREFRFAGQLRARPRRELSATMMIIETNRTLSARLDIDPTINEVQTAYYRRQLEETLLVRAEAESYRNDQKVSPMCPPKR